MLFLFAYMTCARLIAIAMTVFNYRILPMLFWSQHTDAYNIKYKSSNKPKQETIPLRVRKLCAIIDVYEYERGTRTHNVWCLTLTLSCTHRNVNADWTTWMGFVHGIEYAVTHFYSTHTLSLKVKLRYNTIFTLRGKHIHILAHATKVDLWPMRIYQNNNNGGEVE